jgi:hypothetical protein
MNTESPTPLLRQALINQYGERTDQDHALSDTDKAKAWREYDFLHSLSEIHSIQNLGPKFEILELKEIDDDGDLIDLMGFFTKGHVDRWEFVQAVNRYTNADPVYDQRYIPLRLDDKFNIVRHEWWRNVPVRGSNGSYRITNAEPRSKGAYPVTVTEIIADRRRRTAQHQIDNFNSGQRNGFIEGLNWTIRALENKNPELATEIIKMYREEQSKKN